MALISCENIALSYEGTPVLSGLSFQVSAGDYLCIVGENGSGKSTLMKALLGLKRIDSGRIVLGDGLRRSDMGYLPQQTETQKDFPASVWEVAISGCLAGCGLRPFYSSAEKARAERALERLGMSGLKKRSYRELSGGQQQRVLLARALCATERIILLDEPVTGLDPIATGELYAAVKEINDSGVAVVMVSHDIKSSMKYASHILHIRGEHFCYGRADEYSETEIGRHFLGYDDGKQPEKTDA